MQLDPRTLALYTAAIGLGLAILTLLFGRVQRTYPGFDHWVLALATFAAALCSVALRGSVPAAVVRYGPPGFGLATVFAIVYSGVLTFILFKVIDKTMGIRVEPRVEEEGLDIYEHGENAYN